MTKMLGYSEDEFLNHYSQFLTTNESKKLANKFKKHTFEGLEQPPYTLNFKHKDGTIRNIEVMELPVLDDERKVIAVEGIARDITDQINAREQLNYLAQHDALTGIPNRYSLLNKLEKIIRRNKRDNTQFALLFIDLDHFKNINDTLGHNIGDKLINAVVNKIQPSIRKNDVFARIGGDEFIIVINRVSERNLIGFIKQTMEKIREEWLIDEFEIQISSSIGIAIYPEDGTDSQTLMKNADIAMYKAKNVGRDTFSLFTDEINQQIQEEISLEKGMAKGLENQEFVLHYQPKLDVNSNKIVGIEALVRWNHPKKGLVSPVDFIQIAENTGFIIKLGRWIIEEACSTVTRINKKCHTNLHVAINVSARQIENDNLHQVLKSTIEKTNVEPSQIQIELTESILMEYSKNIIKALKDIKSLGIVICMDDFGTGYSSLSYLNKFPIDVLKIDKVFVDEISETNEGVILLDSIIAMASTLNLQAVAEGVETPFQRQYLQKLDCPHYQGFLFSKPIPEEELILLVQQQSV